MLQNEHSAILTTCTKLQPVLKTFVLSISSGRLRQVCTLIFEHCNLVLSYISLFVDLSGFSLAFSVCEPNPVSHWLPLFVNPILFLIGFKCL